MVSWLIALSDHCSQVDNVLDSIAILALIRGGGGGRALAGPCHDCDTLEFDPWSMVKKVDHGH